MERTPRVFLDASVLYPVSLRHLLMRLALAGLFQPQWSAHVHEEWIRAVLRDNPQIPRARLLALRDAMDQRIDDAVVTGFEHLIGTLTLPDPDDRHVLAAAIVSGSSIILTRNLRDFPASALGPHGIAACHPDVFIAGLLCAEAQSVIQAVRDQQASLINPPVPWQDLLAIFERTGLRGTVAELRRMLGL
ncbi:MAG TPA: PIN domain-containing protein [Acetobacteraceae bacterium]|nr:PIN domain-containing protein [Acetobacteraceae bacterium]